MFRTLQKLDDATRNVAELGMSEDREGADVPTAKLDNGRSNLADAGAALHLEIMWSENLVSSEHTRVS